MQAYHCSGPHLATHWGFPGYRPGFGFGVLLGYRQIGSTEPNGRVITVVQQYSRRPRKKNRKRLAHMWSSGLMINIRASTALKTLVSGALSAPNVHSQEIINILPV